MKVGESVGEFKIGTERLQEKRNNHFEDDSETRNAKMRKYGKTKTNNKCLRCTCSRSYLFFGLERGSAVDAAAWRYSSRPREERDVDQKSCARHGKTWVLEIGRGVIPIESLRLRKLSNSHGSKRSSMQAGAARRTLVRLRVSRRAALVGKVFGGSYVCNLRRGEAVGSSSLRTLRRGEALGGLFLGVLRRGEAS